MEKGLLTSLADLTTDLDHHFEELVKIEEPLQKPFDTEILSIRTTTVGDDGKGSQQEVLLQDRIANFRRLREEKEKALCRLWDEWEDTQFQLIRLPAEVLGAHSMTFAQNCEEDMKPGQKSRLDDALRLDPGGPQEEVAPHESLEQDLEAFQEQMHQISTKTKKTVTEMQQVGVSRPLGITKTDLDPTAIQRTEEQIVQRSTSTYRAPCCTVTRGHYLGRRSQANTTLETPRKKVVLVPWMSPMYSRGFSPSFIQTSRHYSKLDANGRVLCTT